jgi:5-formyltetrahydrofolate cyclo-ligase
MSNEDKQALRTRLRAARRARTEAERRDAAGRLAANAALLVPAEASDIACYVSTPTEPATDVLITALRLAGHRVWVPRVDGERLAWVRIDADTAWADGPHGIREPQGPGQALLPGTTAVVFAPALAVDRSGSRLGQGGGYYDRAMLDLPTQEDGGPPRVALVFRDEVLDTVPIEPHDLRVDAIVTD